MAESNRKHGYKVGGVSLPAEAAERRRVETVAITAQRRDTALRSKRLRRESSRQSLGVSRDPSLQSLGGGGSTDGEVMALETPADVAQQVAAAAEKLKAAKPVGSGQHLEAVQELRRLLSNFEDPPYQEALAAGAVPLLVAALQPPRVDATALEAIFEAAWALTNLAVGQHEVVKAVLPAAPLLIAYLGGGSGLAVAEQCAWALGNIAAEDSEFRDTLVANGAIHPLVHLIQRADTALTRSDPKAVVDDDDPVLAAGTTAAWALSNVLRGAGKEVGEVMGVEGGAPSLVSLVGRAPQHLATEVAWVLAYVTASHETHLNRLVALGIVPPLVARLAQVAGEGDQEDVAGRALLIPLLRTLGNVAAGGGRAACEQLLSPDTAPGLQAVVVFAQSHHHGLQKEAAWVLSNVAGAPGREGIEAVKRVGGIQVLMQLVRDAPFHVRKEAAYAIANVCAGGGGGTGDEEALNWLFAADRGALVNMVSLMRSPDMDAAKLGLQFAEMVLRCLPNGAEAIEAADGIDAMEAVQFGDAPPELQQMAAALVDKYYGAD